MAKTGTPFEKAASAYRRPCLRTDLKLVYENPETGKGQVRIVDPKSGRQYTFSEKEHALCRLADGRLDLEQIHNQLEDGDAKTSPAELVEFFRRLHILGLLEPEGTEAPQAVTSSAAGRASGLRNRRQGPGLGATRGAGAGLAPSMGRAGRVGVPGSAADTTEVANRVRARAARKARPSEETQDADADTPSAATRADAGRKAPEEHPDAETGAPFPKEAPVPSSPSEAEKAVSGDRSRGPSALAAGPGGRRGRGLGRTGPGQAEGPRRSESQAGLTAAAARVRERARKPADPASDTGPDSQPVSGKTVPAERAASVTATEVPDPVERSVRPEPVEASLPRPEPEDILAPGDDTSADDQAPARPDVPAFNFFDTSIDEADAGMMGGMGGAMRGGGGGGMMGGAMRGGMGGGMMRGGGGGGMGGMGGMMGGGMMGGAMRGGMGGGMMGGGMGGGAASAGPKMPGQWKWLNPQGLLRLFYVLFYPLKYVLWAIVPLVTIAGLSMLNNFDELVGDLLVLFTDVSSVTQLAVGLFIVNLFSRIAQGVAIVAHGGKVPALGIALIMGVLPRFYVDKRGIAELDRKGQLWSHGAPLLSRLMTFALGILIWATTRETGTFLPQVALIAAQFGLVMFVATSWPLMLSDGMRWLSTYLNEPKLVPKAVIAFKHVFLRAPLPPMMSKRDVPALIFFAIGSILSMTLILSVIGLGVLIFLESALDGLGVLIFLGMVGAFTIWALALWASVTAQGKAQGNFNKEAFRHFTQGARPTADAMPDLEGLEEEALPSKAKVVWGVILVVLLVLAFQPYKYDAGGEVVILPVSKAQAIARTDGEIIEVLVAEGDRVSRGQVLAQLSSWDQERQVAVTQTDLIAAEANLARLKAGASPEEIEVARRQVASAEASLAFSQAEFDRAEELLASGTVSRAAFEQAQSRLATDIAGLEVAQASLDLVLAEASANDIAIVQSEVDRLQLELQFHRDELERTRVVAPMEGRIVTANLQLLIGKYLRSGDPLLEIENAQVVTAEIAVPESDIALIEGGDTVRLRVTGHADTEILGEVQTIAPAAENEGYGSIVRVAAIFENETDFLRSGMTGYAKIDGAEMRAWEAYLRSIRRFVQIEVWSWIP